MKIDRLLHVNIRCSSSDLPQLEKFYEGALGMKSGYAPISAAPARGSTMTMNR